MISSLDTGAKTGVLIEALPWISRYEGKTVVIKYGGAAMAEEELKETFAQDVSLLTKIGVRVAIVHGGGKDITAVAAALGIPTRFVDGQRYTDAPMMDVVLMVLAGKTNKEIVARINRHSGSAAGLCGVDADLLRVERYRSNHADLGMVGTVVAVNTSFLNVLLGNGVLPVIAPLGVDEDRIVYNVNADIAAAALASSLRAEKLVYLSDVEGIMTDGHLIHTIGEGEAERLIDTGEISGGMIPKVRSAFDALRAGVTKVHMIDGRVQHSLLLEIFTDTGIGTELVHDTVALQ
jgi:acetylglutamate kinase